MSASEAKRVLAAPAAPAHRARADGGRFGILGWGRSIALGATLASTSCGNADPAAVAPKPVFTREQLMDPSVCGSCHNDHYAEWAASLHASAARDPVFVAMNRRGNEETNGALGTFCVRCHAPLAVSEGLTSDGLNLDSLPERVQGVTCYFCHNAASVEGTHNNPVLLDEKQPLVVRGGIQDPLFTNAHGSGSSPLLTGSDPSSATLCGSCHDIVLDSPAAPPSLSGSPVELERTFAEWQGTIFAPGHDAQNPNGISCGGCHMPPPARGAEGPVARGVTKQRKLHDHVFPGVDVALDATTSADALALAEPEVQGFLDTTLRVARLCVEYPTDPLDRARIRLLVDIDNVGAGHFWPSGAAQDRRAWIDVRVLVDEQQVYASGDVADADDVTASSDPDLFLLRDQITKADGTPAHMFWEAAADVPGTIPGAITRVVGAPGYDNTHAVRAFPRAANAWIDAPYDPARLRVELRIRIQPIGFDVLDDLVASGHLDASVRAAVHARTLLLNGTFARPDLIAVNPGLQRFQQESFEWSSLTLNSPYFAAASTRSLGTSQFSCTGMNRTQ